MPLVNFCEMRLWVTLSYLFLCGLYFDCGAKYAFVTWENEVIYVGVSDYAFDLPEVTVARATYSNEINDTGWAFLEIHTSRDCSDEKQAYAAGFLEGYLTQELIWMHWQNMLKGYCYNKTDVCSLIEGYLNENEKYIKEMVENSLNNPYWYQVKLYYIQLEGLTAGYNEATVDKYEWLTFRDIFWINMLGDLDELAFALSMPKDAGSKIFTQKFPFKLKLDDPVLFPDHCTGLVKLLPDCSELYMSQVTWNSYQSMLRIQKMYVLHFKMSEISPSIIPGYKMSLSSYPAFVQSTDDFYIISSGLVLGETTIGNSNRTLYEYIEPRGQILEFVRAMVANRLATCGSEWVDIFQLHNSGTYNNQWFIVDYKKFKPSDGTKECEIQPGLLWVVEQLPGYVESADLTEKLVKESYYPSYNIAMFPRVFNLSGGAERVAAFGDWFGYRTNPRARIIRQKQASIRNLKDMFYTMRYNDFKHDPLARCDECFPPYSACNAIAARNDLNPANGSYPFRALGHRSHGATDVKITSSLLRRQFQMLSVSSPTYNVSRGIPPFRSVAHHYH